MAIQRPSDQQQCPSCFHHFGFHFLSFNGEQSGCTVDGCVCQGFVDYRR